MGPKVQNVALTLAALVILQAVAPGTGFAGGVIKYKVKVKNDVPNHTCTVDVYCGDVFSTCRKSYTLAPGAEYTFTVEGPQCTRVLDASCEYLNISTAVYRRCISGSKEDTWQCPAACWSSDWVIREHPGTPYGSIHFDKQ
jgi:hypothetical protein